MSLDDLVPDVATLTRRLADVGYLADTSLATALFCAVRLPQPLLLGLVAGFLEFIPNLGPTLAQIPAVLFALTSSSSTISGLDAGLMYAVVVSLTYIGIQQLEAIFLVPRILGNSLNLHPFVVLVAILIGSNLAAFLIYRLWALHFCPAPLAALVGGGYR